MPSGKVKWYEKAKGFGFITTEDGKEIYVNAAALPEGVHDLRPGTRLEFGVAEGRRGPQALSLRILEEAPSVARAKRKNPEQQAAMIEDLIKVLDQVSNTLRKGRYPEQAHGKKVATVLRAVADDLDV
ncbi:cold-shock protein [Arthrobacter sp. MYb211]|uniref:cold-shock protein n=1 Tax=Micrococcaceae TaxID=1268 RepID=UPI000BB91074|nr:MULTISPECIES: cold shock domain-containing protein [Micrococcaceae]PCC27214.1 cold-shock protein [Glutamicibacter sp. BW80]PQZ97389.1 cold-shock protein [Arthrobacter sp. MYb224]PRA00821.1 cold-shock protein [Arthrobacter sp. MYb229]PRA10769.1 cold-shock protein [Arthrobacter sp. MYb221]PRB48755.1 cold-shock protein [Arthrobacter sp. MYb216]